MIDSGKNFTRNILMCRLFRRNPQVTDQESLMREIEKRVEHDRRRKSISISFWGTLTLNPNEVYVSPEQAERSRREIEKFLQARQQNG
jgi:hypothetical protein